MTQPQDYLVISPQRYQSTSLWSLTQRKRWWLQETLSHIPALIWIEVHRLSVEQMLHITLQATISTCCITISLGRRNLVKSGRGQHCAGTRGGDQQTGDHCHSPCHCRWRDKPLWGGTHSQTRFLAPAFFMCSQATCLSSLKLRMAFHTMLLHLKPEPKPT
jgi:hypothetical protein